VLSVEALKATWEAICRQEPQPIRYEWRCSACNRAGYTIDHFAPCPFCGGKSVFAAAIERSEAER
jgi:hypothetical protein